MRTNRFVSIALSCSLLGFATPAFAKAKTSSENPPVRMAAIQTEAAPVGLASPFRRSGLELNLYGGLGTMFGGANTLGFTTTATTTNTTSTQPVGAGSSASNPPVSVSNWPSQSQSTYYATAPAFGWTVGSGLTYWLNDAFGLSLDLAHARNAGNTNVDLGLPSGTGTNTTATASVSTTPASGSIVTTNVKTVTSQTSWSYPNGSWNFSTSNAPFMGNASGDLTPNADPDIATNRQSLTVDTIAGLNFQVAAQSGAFGTSSNTFYNTDPIRVATYGSDTVTAKYTADAKVRLSGSEDRSLSMWNLFGRTLLFDNGRVELSMLTGITAPSVGYNRMVKAEVTNKAGNAPATQVVTRTDTRAGAANTSFQETTSVRETASYTTEAGASMYGPMMGLAIRTALSPAIQLYGGFGWSPVVVGNGTVRQTSTVEGTITTRIDSMGAAAAAVINNTDAPSRVAGATSTRTVDNSVTTSGNLPSVLFNANGVASTANLGARYALSDFMGVFAEGQVKSFNAASGNVDLSSTLTTLNLGLSFLF